MLTTQCIWNILPKFVHWIRIELQNKHYKRRGYDSINNGSLSFLLIMSSLKNISTKKYSDRNGSKQTINSSNFYELTVGVRSAVITGASSPLTPKKPSEIPLIVAAKSGAMSTKEQMKPPLKDSVFPTSTKLSKTLETHLLMLGISITMRGIMAARLIPVKRLK